MIINLKWYSSLSIFVYFEFLSYSNSFLFHHYNLLWCKGIKSSLVWSSIHLVRPLLHPLTPSYMFLHPLTPFYILWHLANTVSIFLSILQEYGNIPQYILFIYWPYISVYESVPWEIYGPYTAYFTQWISTIDIFYKLDRGDEEANWPDAACIWVCKCWRGSAMLLIITWSQPWRDVTSIALNCKSFIWNKNFIVLLLALEPLDHTNSTFCYERIYEYFTLYTP